MRDRIFAYVKLTNICKKISNIHGVIWGNSVGHCHRSMKVSQPRARAAQKTIITDCKGIEG